MTNTPKSDRAALERLADALVEDILGTADAELLAEAETGEDDGADKARAAFRRAVALSRLTAKTGARRHAVGNVRALNPRAARRWLEEFIAEDPESVDELAAAARKIGGLSDEDVFGVLERLQKRSAPEQRDGGRDGR